MLGVPVTDNSSGNYGFLGRPPIVIPHGPKTPPNCSIFSTSKYLSIILLGRYIMGSTEDLDYNLLIHVRTHSCYGPAFNRRWILERPRRNSRKLNFTVLNKKKNFFVNFVPTGFVLSWGKNDLWVTLLEQNL